MREIKTVQLAYRIGFAHAFNNALGLKEFRSVQGDSGFQSTQYMAREIAKYYFEVGIYKEGMRKTRRMFRAFTRGFNECSQLIMEVQNG